MSSVWTGMQVEIDLCGSAASTCFRTANSGLKSAGKPKYFFIPNLSSL